MGTALSVCLSSIDLTELRSECSDPMLDIVEAASNTAASDSTIGKVPEDS